MSEADLLEDPAPPAPPRRRFRWGCLAVLLVLFTACGGFYALLLHKFNTDLDAAVAETDRLEPDGRFPIQYSRDFVSTTISSQDARAGASLLQHEAILLAQEGKIDAAVGATRGIVASGRAVGDEPLLVSQLIRLACQAVAVNTLE